MASKLSGRAEGRAKALAWRRVGPIVFRLSLASGCDGGTAISPTAREICEAAVRCAPSMDLEECTANIQAQLDVAVETGCVAEANAANRCSLDHLEIGDGGACSADLDACGAQYRAYNACLTMNGGTHDVSCEVDATTFRYCVRYNGLPSDPETTCSALSGTLVSECSTSDVVGTCRNEVAGVEVITTYYGPLSPGVDTELLANICMEQGGTWSMP